MRITSPHAAQIFRPVPQPIKETNRIERRGTADAVAKKSDGESVENAKGSRSGKVSKIKKRKKDKNWEGLGEEVDIYV
tara:strand:+ start:227 stop:460 length:234 start_codon:yes stop_codon:yes gene_type:complete